MLHHVTIENHGCPVCFKPEPQWPTCDIATGWTFCGDCYTDARKAFSKAPDKVWPNWIRAIAEVSEIVRASS